MSMTLHSKTVVVATAGTPVKAFASTTLARTAVIVGLAANSGYAYPMGQEKVKAFSVSASSGMTLPPMGEALYDLSDLWIDADTSGEGVGIIWYG